MNNGKKSGVKKANSFIKLFRKHLIAIISIIVLIIGSFWIYDEYSLLNIEAELKLQSLVTADRKRIKDEVLRIKKYIEYKKSQTEKKLKISIAEHGREAHAIAGNLYKQHKNSKSREEIVKIIKDALRPIRFNGTRGYLFATQLDGVEQLFADKPHLEGKNLLGMQDINGKYVIRDMIKLVREEGEGFYRYTWSKPESEGHNYPKIAFVKYFAPLDWFIGTGEYLDDVTNDLQKEVLEWVGSLRYGDKGYFFIHTFSGINLSHLDKKIIGTDVSTLQDFKGVRFVEELTNISTRVGGGSFQYTGHFDPRTGQPGEKISYVVADDEWQWVIGTGTYIDQLDSLRRESKVVFKNNIINSIFRIAVVLFIALALIFFSISSLSSRFMRNFHVFKSFFKEAASDEKPIAIEKLDIKEFVALGVSANNMLEQRGIAEKEKIVLEEQLRQSHKMEAIGTLAGGIAHDFNNILSIIIGYSEMARDDSEPGSAVAKDLENVLVASNRAKALVQQILAFSRQADAEPIQLQPATIVKEAVKIIRPSIPSTIELNLEVAPDSCIVLADPTQFTQVVMNLCTNAFHAMESKGGILDVLLHERFVTAEELQKEPVQKYGRYIQLEVRDTGVGMSPEIITKIFDPFFSTKEIGKGTGMGLALVHGIVKNSGGFITVESELGQGTAVNVYFPCVDEETDFAAELIEKTPAGSEKILYIDDEDALANMGMKILERLGYQVTVRQNSLEALRDFQDQPYRFDLVITDQTMPEMTGAELAERMLLIRPDIPIILCTGYSSIISEEEAKKIGIREFALKPLSKANLAELIRKALDSEVGNSGKL